MAKNLFFVILGGTPADRYTEQHDVFFGIGDSLGELLPDMEAFWPGTKLHIDSWRCVTNVNGYAVKVVSKEGGPLVSKEKLFFLNLGGYKPGDMEEYHYKLLCAAVDKGAAVKQASQTAFYQHTGFRGATSHIDDKYGVDVDDIHEIEDILPASLKTKYSIVLEKNDEPGLEDELHIGYVKLSSLM